VEYRGGENSGKTGLLHKVNRVCDLWCGVLGPLDQDTSGVGAWLKLEGSVGRILGLGNETSEERGSAGYKRL
jgi:hypothetical protein